MSARAGFPRAARPPGTDWQDSYFALEERYRRLQKSLNEKEQELKVIKVARRKEEAPRTGPSISSPSARSPPRSSLRAGGTTNPKPHQSPGTSPQQFLSASDTPLHASGETAGGPGHRSVAFESSVHPSMPHSGYRDELHREHEGPPPGTSSSPDYAHFLSSTTSRNAAQEYVSVASAAAPQVERAAAISEASAWGEAGALPDPAMVWGTDDRSSLQNYVVASALYHANEELRRKLNESATTLQTLQQELASSRAQHAAVHTRLENAATQMHQLVRERDLSLQKYTNASHTIKDLERTLSDRVGEEEKVRFSLENQIAELRSRLVSGADSNDLLQKDVRSLLAETRDRTGEVMKLRSQLALAESALSSQRNTNENMLVELRSLNGQLVEERKRLITCTREAQLASLSQTRISDLEAQLKLARDERSAVEREHVGLMSEFVHVTEDALRHAREEVRSDMADWKAAASHWEQVSQLLYKDVAEHTQQHLQCRAECEDAQQQRDAAALQVRALKEEVALLSAKLDVVWPSHLTDAKGLTAAELLQVFGRKDRAGIFLFDKRRRLRRRRVAEQVQQRGGAIEGEDDGAAELAPSSNAGKDEEEDGAEEDAGFDLAARVLEDLPADPTTALCQLQELHEANAVLVSEVHQLRLTNDLLQDRLNGVTGRQKKEQERVTAAEASLQEREKAGHRLLEKQLDRVAFLEAQVKSLRGYHVPANSPIDQVGDDENIFELFLGQLVAAEVPDGVDVPDMFSSVFCSADFLLHETITTDSVRGFNGFFDVTASFCVSMDSLLFYYLHTRQLLVQLHRVRDVQEAAGIISTMEEGGNAPGSSNAAGDVATPRSGHGGSAHSSTHQTLCMAEQMFETIAEGQVSLADIVLMEECRHAARPTLKGHVRLFTPAGRHLASLEFRLTARRPYSDAFVQLVEDSGVTIGATMDDDGAVKDTVDYKVHGSSSHLLEWMQTTAGTSRDSAAAVATRYPKDHRPAGGGPSRRHISATSPIDLQQLSRPNQLQLIPVPSSDLETSSSLSSHMHQLSRMAETPNALVVHLPAPSPPPPRWRSASPWVEQGTSFTPQEGEASRGASSRRLWGEGQSPPSHLSGHSPTVERSPVTTSFMHVDRCLLPTKHPDACKDGGRSSLAAQLPDTAVIRCLWVDVERLELPADLALPIPRLSCYFHIAPAQWEVTLKAPPTPRYTWAYTIDASQGVVGAFGVALPVSTIAQIAAVLREPLVLFLLDADAMASTAAAASSSPCVWAMVVCEWAQAVQHHNEPQRFALPLLRRDQSVVQGAVLRLSLTATTQSPQESSAAVPLQTPSRPWVAETAASDVHSGGADRGNERGGDSNPSPSRPLVPPPPLQAQAQPSSLTQSMEEELLRLAYEHRAGSRHV